MMDFSSICRTCLGSESLNPIFMTNHDNLTYSNAIYLATGVKVQYNDNLPQKMCMNCLNKLRDIFKFRLQCKSIESKLLKIIANGSTVSDKGINNTESTIKKNNSRNNSDDPIKLEFKDNYVKDEMGSDEDEIELFLESQSSYLKTVAFETKDEFNCDNISEPKSEIEDKDLTDDIQIQLPQSIVLKSTMINARNNNLDNENANMDTKSTTNLVNQKTSNRNKSPTKLPKKSTLITKSNKPHISDDKIKPKANKTVLKSNVKYNSTRSETIETSVEIPYRLITDSTTEKVTKAICKLCNKELSIRSIDYHMTRWHPGADERKVKCDLCDTYIMRNKVNRHRVMMHGNAGFKCGYCKKEFINKEKLREHVTCCTAKKQKKRKASDSSRELRECEVCKKVMQKASLRMHMAVKHAGLRPVCEHCGKSFSNKFRLKEHYRAKHDYEKFQCSSCEFKSAGVMAMRNHERRHRGEKPFVCETCGAKFHAAYLLTQHKHSHKTEKLIKCDLCPASFKANNNLHMHKLTCHSAKMYRCIVCSKTYKCRHYAVKHVRHVHRYNGSTPPLTVIMNEDL